jgi:uncharacterized protein (TIGR02118 family)
MTYYINKHMPMVKNKVAACKGVAAEQGLSAGTPGSAPTYIAIGYLLFDSVESFELSFGPKAPEILADIPNYTNTRPVIQISEVTL